MLFAFSLKSSVHRSKRFAIIHRPISELKFQGGAFKEISSISLVSFRKYGVRIQLGKFFRKGTALSAFSFYSLAQSLAVLSATVHPYFWLVGQAIYSYPYLEIMAFFKCLHSGIPDSVTVFSGRVDVRPIRYAKNNTKTKQKPTEKHKHLHLLDS